MTNLKIYFSFIGKGCDFVLKPCTDRKTYPYICDTDHSTCTFDHVSKVQYFLMGVAIQRVFVDT